MGNLFTSLLNSAGAMQAFDRQLAAIQNNVSNANTPGYARQTQSLESLPFDVVHGLPGGVMPGQLISSRAEYAEQNVRAQTSRLGFSDQQTGNLSQMEPYFDLTSDSGVASSITSFFNSFSRLSVSPNDGVSRQSVLDSAHQLADSFQLTSAGLVGASTEADQHIQDTVSTINGLVDQLSTVNAQYRQSNQSVGDPGLDAKVHATLEELSSLADVTMTRTPDGLLSVYLGGETPLIVDNYTFRISSQSVGPQTVLLDKAGQDITSHVHSGKLAGALQTRNQLIPSYETDLNNLAGTIATKVNQQLAAGVDVKGNSPTVNLFNFDPVAGAAATISVSTITADQIAAADAASPGGNGNALSVADLGKAQSISGATFTGYIGQLSARLGRDLSNAKADQGTQAGLLNQSKAFRQQISGVSLDEEATQLMQVQRAYQAAGKLLTVINDMLDTLMQTVR